MRRTVLLAVLASAGLMTHTLSANVIGSLSITNCSSGSVTVSSNTITWLLATSGTTGCVATGSPTGLTYGPAGADTLGWGATGNILNLTLGVPPGAAFMTFANQSGTGFGVQSVPDSTIPWNQNGTTLSFFLSSVGPPSPNAGSAACATATSTDGTCSVSSASPFTLTYLGGNITLVGLLAGGTITDPTVAGGVSSWSGGFSTQVTGTPTSIYNTICGGGSTISNCTPAGTVNNTYSATFTVTVVPEPGTIGMMLIGAALIGISGKRKARKV